jgi:hypothetical protein
MTLDTTVFVDMIVEDFIALFSLLMPSRFTWRQQF